MEHTFKLNAQWNGGLGGQGKMSVGKLETDFSVPTDLKGPGHGSNPEEMLLGAASACYLITLGAILERREVPVSKIELHSEATVDADKGGLKFVSIVHQPTVHFSTSITPEQREQALAATERAEKACMISNAIRNNVAVSVHATLK